MAFYFCRCGGLHCVFEDAIQAIFLLELIQHHSVAKIFWYYQPVQHSSSVKGLLIQLLQRVIKALFPAHQSTTSQRSDAVNRQRSSGYLWLFLLASAGSICGSSYVCRRQQLVLLREYNYIPNVWQQRHWKELHSEASGTEVLIAVLALCVFCCRRQAASLTPCSVSELPAITLLSEQQPCAHPGGAFIDVLPHAARAAALSQQGEHSFLSHHRCLLVECVTVASLRRSLNCSSETSSKWQV